MCKLQYYYALHCTNIVRIRFCHTMFSDIKEPLHQKQQIMTCNISELESLKAPPYINRKCITHISITLQFCMLICQNLPSTFLHTCLHPINDFIYSLAHVSIYVPAYRPARLPSRWSKTHWESNIYTCVNAHVLWSCPSAIKSSPGQTPSLIDKSSTSGRFPASRVLHVRSPVGEVIIINHSWSLYIFPDFVDYHILSPPRNSTLLTFSNHQ